MALRTDAYYRSLAEETVRGAGIEEPPVPLERIAESLGVPIVRHALPLWFSAALIYEDGMPTILLNTEKEPQTQRDATGHVLGHLIVLMHDQSASYPRDTGLDHHDADVVGADLEVPEFLVREQAQKWFNDYRYLARLFGVSEKRMLDKMQGMGLIKSRGIIWDY
ncbi:MAG: hypothetical protein Kow0067_11830 [Coriobacteriia bacterium]